MGHKKPEDSKCLVVLFLFRELVSYFKTLPPASEYPRFVFAIEESHTIVGGDIRDAQAGEMPNIQAHAAKLIVNMMAELRVLGVAVIIIDQNITAISEFVFRNTTSKVVFKQNDDADRSFICRSILLPKFMTDDLGRSRVGEAYFITDDFYRARKIRTPNFLAEYPVDRHRAATDLGSIIKDQAWFKAVHEPRVLEELNLFASSMDDYERKEAVLTENFFLEKT